MSGPMTGPLSRSLEHPDLLAGWVVAEGVEVADCTAGLRRLLRSRVGNPERHGLDETTRAAIRDLLRGRGYKPSGRGKPASEYLAATASSGSFPEINSVVDVNNLVSLETGWPISVFDLDEALAGTEGLELRFGRPGESFPFNDAGQTIGVEGLVCVARAGGEPIGNPVKDSMEAKISSGTRRVLAVIYASRGIATPDEVVDVARRYGALLQTHAGASSWRAGVLGEDV